MLKIMQLGFSSMWTKNFQMYKLDLEKAENQTWNNGFFKSKKEYIKAVCCHPDYLTSMQSACVLSCFSHVCLTATREL